ncbi:integrase [Rhodoferax koreense]|uniref:Integrase n=1 Tax=Rhodoferax koreensis TaxID=1842727 RepID=A0A1P8JXM9_9BURK|nr:tyrosine-type recombinase/integrase [Rhodoferax koreense]APW38498.1 integrase [Rhodoferax koreense]
MKKRELPKRVFERSGTYWYVTAQGDIRKWTKLSRVSEGMPAMYRALAELMVIDATDDSMPALIATWMKEVSTTRGAKTQENDLYRSKVLSESFKEFRAKDVKVSSVIEFLKAYKTMPRSYNAYRATLREILRFAEEKDMRDPGSNPVDSTKTMSIKPRRRYITDSKLRRIKVAAMYGEDGKRTKSGPMLCALIDLAYLTGQRIGDLLALEWSNINRYGITFEPGKTEDSTAVRILILWTPKLKAVIARIKAIGNLHIRYVITTKNAQPYRYSGASSAWSRAVERAGYVNCHFHDIRAKSLTDKEKRDGMQAARLMGGHSTEQQTADYIASMATTQITATR